MNKRFVDQWEKNKEKIRSKISEKQIDSYIELVKIVIENITSDDYGDIDPERIHQVNDGGYQGTLLFIIAAKGYQPSDYYFVKINYGSCSGCDTLQSISNYSSEPPTQTQINKYMTLALHIVQGLKELK